MLENTKIINIEGVDGTGKSTIAKYLDEVLKEKGYKTLLLHEPGSTTVGEKIRRILKGDEQIQNEMTTTLLFLASRAELIERIKSSHADYIILDRFSPSTIAYQARNSEYLDWVMTIDKKVRQGVEPDIVLFLYCEISKCFARLNERDGKLDGYFNQDNAFVVQDRYVVAKNVLGWKWRGVYAGGSLDATKNKVLEILVSEGIL